jgi:hypothetical protein
MEGIIDTQQPADQPKTDNRELERKAALDRSIRACLPIVLSYRTEEGLIRSQSLMTAELHGIAEDLGLQIYVSPGMEDETRTTVTICGTIFVVDVCRLTRLIWIRKELF